jgi:pimeloyl-ACP methyl ester carboxylesterase
MLRIRSADGTSIRCWREGAGPPLVLVHGTTPITPRSGSSPPILASRFTVYAMDRRGRGASEDSSEYATEVEDVVAVVAALGPDGALFGHSFGADLALQASARTSNLSRLVLCEPGGGGDGDPTNVQARLETLIAASEREAALVLVFQEVAGLSDAEINQAWSSSIWSLRLAAVHTVPGSCRPRRTTGSGPRETRRWTSPQCCCSVRRVRRGRGPRPRPWRRPCLTPPCAPGWAGTRS